MFAFRACSRSSKLLRLVRTNAHLRAYSIGARHRTGRIANPAYQSIFKQQTRHASASAETSPTSRLINFFYGASLVLGLGIVYLYITDTRASVHRWIVIPALRLVFRDPEDAHSAGNLALKALWNFNLHPRERGNQDAKEDLVVEVLGQKLQNPIATSAGIDKHADIPDALFAIGPAIIEIGGATPLPQAGNDKPRVFRLTSQNAMINRYGLNSEGADHVAMRLRKRVREFAQSLSIGRDEAAEKHVLNGGAGVPPGSLTEGKLLAVNIAKNKATPGDDVEAVTNDYVYCVDRLGPYADILVVNVSSPNTPGLRNLQQGDTLKQILTGVVLAAKSVDRSSKPAVMVKVSPDEDSDEQIAGICHAVWSSGVDGVIVGNTTNRRPGQLPHLRNMSPLEEQNLLEQGGFSGPHLFDQTVALVKRYRRLLTDEPDEIGPPTRSRDLLKAEAERLRASIEASTGAKPTKKPDKITTSVDTGPNPLENIAERKDSEKQALIKLPTDKFYNQPKSEQDSLNTGEDINELVPHDSAQRDRLQSILSALDQLPAKEPIKASNERKVIFATGGITNGKQALEVLNTGADVAMVYTALVYGGIGTISRIKNEMRAEIAQGKAKRASNG